MGVNKPKNNTPNTTGLIIIPSNNPKSIHILFKGKRRFGLMRVTRPKAVAIIKKTVLKLMYCNQKKYPENRKNTDVKKTPNLLFDGSSTSVNFIIKYPSIINEQA
tara:strand:+ start:3650 stop:3964 length:315 start_codon:yes stop_codon:yes gene_type:complete